MDEDEGQRIWFDTEFIEDGRTIDLLSIGAVREDGATYYAEPAETDRSRANDWVRDNVLPYLDGPIKPRTVIAAELVEFAGQHPEWWAYYADYDWVALCQLYGRMIDLPRDWPMYCRDVKQSADEASIDLSQIPVDGREHNALDDALWLRKAADHLYADTRCAHQFRRFRHWPVKLRWRCENCGLVSRLYDGVDAMGTRPIHPHMSVVVKGVNTVDQHATSSPAEPRPGRSASAAP